MFPGFRERLDTVSVVRGQRSRLHAERGAGQPRGRACPVALGAHVCGQRLMLLPPHPCSHTRKGGSATRHCIAHHAVPAPGGEGGKATGRALARATQGEAGTRESACGERGDQQLRLGVTTTVTPVEQIQARLATPGRGSIPRRSGYVKRASAFGGRKGGAGRHAVAGERGG